MIYSYLCKTCQNTFEIVSTVANYQPKVKCPTCKKLSERALVEDLSNSVGSVVRSDDEITVGELALRNRDRFSEDKKIALDKKHNEFKYKEPDRPINLPKGAEIVKRTDKPRWY